jgi:hypothetical protein
MSNVIFKKYLKKTHLNKFILILKLKKKFKYFMDLLILASLID